MEEPKYKINVDILKKDKVNITPITEEPRHKWRGFKLN